MSQHWYMDPDDEATFTFDFAPSENGSANSNFLDRSSSPVEGIASASISIDSPGPNLVSQAIITSSTQVRVTFTVANTTAGETYKVACQVTTNASPIQKETVVAYLHIREKT